MAKKWGAVFDVLISRFFSSIFMGKKQTKSRKFRRKLKKVVYPRNGTSVLKELRGVSIPSELGSITLVYV